MLLTDKFGCKQSYNMVTKLPKLSSAWTVAARNLSLDSSIANLTQCKEIHLSFRISFGFFRPFLSSFYILTLYSVIPLNNK